MKVSKANIEATRALSNPDGSLKGAAGEANDRLVRWLCGLPAKGVREITRGTHKGKFEVDVRGKVFRFHGPKLALVERVK